MFFGRDRVTNSKSPSCVYELHTSTGRRGESRKNWYKKNVRDMRGRCRLNLLGCIACALLSVTVVGGRGGKMQEIRHYSYAARLQLYCVGIILSTCYAVYFSVQLCTWWSWAGLPKKMRGAGDAKTQTTIIQVSITVCWYAVSWSRSCGFVTPFPFSVL